MSLFSIWHWLIALPVLGFLCVLVIGGAVLLVKAMRKGKRSDRIGVDDLEY